MRIYEYKPKYDRHSFTEADWFLRLDAEIRLLTLTVSGIEVFSDVLDDGKLPFEIEKVSFIMSAARLVFHLDHGLPLRVGGYWHSRAEWIADLVAKHEAAGSVVKALQVFKSNITVYECKPSYDRSSADNTDWCLRLDTEARRLTLTVNAIEVFSDVLDDGKLPFEIEKASLITNAARLVFHLDHGLPLRVGGYWHSRAEWVADLVAKHEAVGPEVKALQVFKSSITAYECKPRYGSLSSMSYWSLRLNTETWLLSLTVGGRETFSAVINDETCPLRIEASGFMSYRLVLQTKAGLPILLDGYSRVDAEWVSDLVARHEAAIFRKLTLESFISDYKCINHWVSEATSCLSGASMESRWITSEEQQTLLARRPTLSINGDALERLLADFEAQASLPDAIECVRRLLATWQQDWLECWAASNEEHTRRELVACRPLFDSVETRPLTEEQARAVICFDNRVQVIAAAGSGKTSTMVAKAVYAVQRKIARPDDIVLLAFNKSAAQELGRRAKLAFSRAGLPDGSVEASTFHALGLRIIGDATGRMPTVAEWAVSDGEGMHKLSQIVGGLIQRSNEFSKKWDLFITIYGKDLPSSQAWDRDGSQYIRTLKGDRARSLEEAEICNWLFYNGVNYKYEKSYEFDTVTSEFRQYKPDFYYPDIKLYHEHFALDEFGQPPAHFPGYLEGVAWKRAEHARRGTQLIETTSFQINKKSLDSTLGEELKARGVNLRPDRNRPIPKGGNPPMKDEELVGLLRTFITHAKNNSVTVDDVVQRTFGEPDDRLRRRHVMFLDLARHVVDGWNAALAAEDSIDFEDMLNQAAEHVESERFKSSFKIVMADEFQDASRARARLCRALVRQQGRFFFAVGDDWQSINRFAGSDLNLMTGFKDWFGHCQILKLQQTFRFPQDLCDASSRFVSKNAAQIRKEVTSSTTLTGPVLQVVQVSAQRELGAEIDGYLEQLCTDLRAGRTPSGRDGKVSVFLLGRYKADRAYLPVGWERRYGSRIALSFSTIHSSKGAEADYVILPAMLQSRFPNTRTDDPVLTLAMPCPDNFPLSEERRLFYVALTRARRSVTLFTVAGDTSSFIHELEDDGFVKRVSASGEVVDEERCPACGTGVIVTRVGQYGQFAACSGYPRCEYRPPSQG